MKSYIEAQEKLEMEASKNNLFYAHGCAFNLSKTLMVIPRIVLSDTSIAYDIYKNSRCIMSSNDLGYIFDQVKKDYGLVPLSGLMDNASYALLLDTNMNYLKLIPVYLLEKSDDGSFQIISDFTYTFDSDGYGKRSGVKVQSLFCDLPSALDYLGVKHSTAELHFKGVEQALHVYLDGWVNAEKYVEFRHVRTRDLIRLAKSGNGITLLGDELFKVIVKR